MKLLKINPTSNGRRHQVNICKNLLSKTNRLIKSKLVGIKSFSGRSNGRITVRHQCSASKKLYRLINFSNNNYSGIVVSCQYDPYRSSFISLNYDFLTKSYFNTLQTNLVYPGSLISCSKKNVLHLGSRMQVSNIPSGSLVHSVSKRGKFSQYIRSAGTFGQILQKDFVSCKIKLPSGKILVFPVNSFATLGSLSNLQNSLLVLGKAGRNRYKGVRPSVRGIAMNPVDHPHGGRTNGGIPSVTPWGIPTKGKPTVKKK